MYIYIFVYTYIYMYIYIANHHAEEVEAAVSEEAKIVLNVLSTGDTGNLGHEVGRNGVIFDNSGVFISQS